MFDKKENEIKASDVGMPESAVEAKVSSGKDKGKKVPQNKVNELVFRKGDEVELKGLPFEVKEVKGLELVVCRKDIK